MTKPDSRPWSALAVLALVQFMIVADNTIANVALPSIQDDLGFTTDGLAWVINGYLLTAGGLILFGGRLSDIVGRRRVFLVGAVLFGAASLACGAAPTAEVLVAARFAQGVGEALASPAALSLIAVLFRDPAERAKALGIWGGLSGLGAIVGVVLSGMLTQLLDWRWVFYINLPFAIAAVVLTPRLVGPDGPRDPGAPDRLDLPGATLVTAGATAVVYGLLASVRSGWDDPTVIAALLGGAAALTAFVAVEARTRAPLVPLRFFANRTRVSANLAAVFMIGVMAAIFLLLTLYLQGVRGYSPIRAGLAYLPFCVGFVAAIFLHFPLARAFGAKVTLIVAFLAGALGMVWLGRLPVDGDYATDLLPALLVLAVAFGLGFPGLQAAALHAVSDADAGLGSGIQTAIQALANVLGISALLTIALHHTATLLSAGQEALPAATAGYALAFRVGAASLAVGALVIAIGMPRRNGEPGPPAPADRAPADDGSPGRPADQLAQ